MNDKEQIEKRVFEGIRKTINRFQEKPFHFFTEADIHTSLANDIMFGKSENGTTKKMFLLPQRMKILVYPWFTKNIQPTSDM